MQVPGNQIPGSGGWGAGRESRSGSSGLYQWGVLVGGTALGLTAVGRLYRAGAAGWAARSVLYHGTKARTWAAYNVYKEASDLSHWLHGGKMEWGVGVKARPLSSFYFPYPLVVPFPWVSLNPVKGSSSQDLVQNGGPLAPPPLVVTEPSRRATLGAGSPIPKPPPTRKGGVRRGRCPPGHHWSSFHKKCVKTYPGWQKHW